MRQVLGSEPRARRTSRWPLVCDHGHVKFATSVGHLESVGQQANDYRRLRESDVGWPLDELWIGSELLDSPAELEATPLILVLDAPPEELTWLALHPAGDWICEQLRLTKRPISWRYRPSHSSSSSAKVRAPPSGRWCLPDSTSSRRRRSARWASEREPRTVTDCWRYRPVLGSFPRDTRSS